jgi:hypothetical protein
VKDREAAFVKRQNVSKGGTLLKIDTGKAEKPTQLEAVSSDLRSHRPDVRCEALTQRPVI